MLHVVTLQLDELTCTSITDMDISNNLGNGSMEVDPGSLVSLQRIEMTTMSRDRVA